MEDSPAYEDVEMETGGTNENEGEGEVPDQPMNLVEGSQDRVERLGSAVSSESDADLHGQANGALGAGSCTADAFRV